MSGFQSETMRLLKHESMAESLLILSDVRFKTVTWEAY